MSHEMNEVGRELGVNDLVPRTVVVLQKDGRPMITAWVARVLTDLVMFYMGETRTTLICVRKADGTLEDDTPARIRVFEFLGEV